MIKFFKWFWLILGSLVLIIVVILMFLYSSVNSRLNENYTVKINKIDLPTDSLTLERGRHRALLCQGCHGQDFSGMVVFSSPEIGEIVSPNLTRGEGGIGRNYKNEDWVRTIIHGIKKNGKPLLVMPSEDFHNFSKNDLIALIAYLKTIPPVDHKTGNYRLTFFAKLLVSIGAFGNIINAETIDHTKTYNEEVTIASNSTFGKYMVNISGCRTCHGKGLNGGKDPNPDAPPGPNLTSGGNLGKWNENDFITTIRTGKTPEGKLLKPKFMPWMEFSKMTDLEISAIFKYLKSLPKKETIGS